MLVFKVRKGVCKPIDVDVQQRLIANNIIFFSRLSLVVRDPSGHHGRFFFSFLLFLLHKCGRFGRSKDDKMPQIQRVAREQCAEGVAYKHKEL